MQYEFRTLKDRRHASLVMLAGCDNDIEAILIAQEFLHCHAGRMRCARQKKERGSLERDRTEERKPGGFEEAARRAFRFDADAVIDRAAKRCLRPKYRSVV